MRVKFTIISTVFMVPILILFWGAPALAGTNAHYNNCNCQNVRWEKGVKVYRAQPVNSVSAQAFALYKQQVAAAAQNKVLAEERAAQQAEQNRLQAQAYDRAYNNGYQAGQKTAFIARRQNRSRRNPYNYGRRYSTSFQNPNYARFRSDASYGRPAYLQIRKLKN